MCSENTADHLIILCAQLISLIAENLTFYVINLTSIILLMFLISMIKLLLVIHLIALALSKPGRHFLIETEDEVNMNAVWLKCK